MKIINKVKLQEKFIRYDLTIEDTHTFLCSDVVVHNSSAHVSFKDGKLSFFAGGEKHDKFVSIFDQEKLLADFKSCTTLHQLDIVVYGEVYGGKMQGMSASYGKETKFIAFDVKMNDTWLDVEAADRFVQKLGLEFVPYQLITTDVTSLEVARDAMSLVAVRRGMGNDKIMEGVVLRPTIEAKDGRGNRIIAKFKRPEFRERKTVVSLNDPEKQAKLASAKAVAEEFATPMRLTHVLDKLAVDGVRPGIEQMPVILKAMYEDIKIECGDEFDDSREVAKAIGSKTADMVKKIKLNE